MLHAMQSLKTTMLLRKRLQQMRRVNPWIPRVIFQTKTLLQKLLKLVEVPALEGITTKNYNQPSASYVNTLGKQVVNAPSSNNNENACPKEDFKYDLIEHFKHIPARLHILDLLRMSPHTRDNLISKLQMLNEDVNKHTP
ncbi:hypothetical protein AAC387_Pa03g1655 [Persea americana]